MSKINKSSLKKDLSFFREGRNAELMKKILLILMALASLTMARLNADPARESGVDLHGLQTSDFQWSRGNHLFDVCDGQVTFTNTGNQALGNIHYRTAYYSETGVEHQNSIIDAVIEKVIQPGESRTFQLSFVVPKDCSLATILVISCEVFPNFTQRQ